MIAASVWPWTAFTQHVNVFFPAPPWPGRSNKLWTLQAAVPADLCPWPYDLPSPAVSPYHVWIPTSQLVSNWVSSSSVLFSWCHVPPWVFHSLFWREEPSCLLDVNRKCSLFSGIFLLMVRCWRAIFIFYFFWWKQSEAVGMLCFGMSREAQMCIFSGGWKLL